jgi:hypothetical protein
MDGLLFPFGYPGTKMPGTEILGKGVDPISLSVTAPNGTSYPNKAALQAAINAVAATGKSTFGLGR